ncbi:MAG TPA: sigma 54-interacting transcriptional regulator [Kofleriaceae bacterium]|nr:sigma 54-interacting transcriptional regulator [Kofleriaceae bacterium]
MAYDPGISGESRTRSSTSLKSAIGLPGGVVRALDGRSRGKSARIGDRPVLVGSGEEADLRLSDPKVSRRHVEIGLGRFGFVVSDLGSRNGTLFEGSRVSQASLPPGAILRLGDTHVVLMAEADERRLPPSPRASFGRLVGGSPPMRQMYALLERAADSDATVLLLGETGTGKELAARALHDEGPRARAPYEIFDCGAVAGSLIASDLFGHVKGAFTGAAADRPGIFERAHGGTVFIDEVAELPLDLQPALLRVCDRGEVTRVGSTHRVRVDVRIIAATRRDIAAEVVAGRFREDLFYRLGVISVTLPPLRARRSDLPALCTAILRDLGMADPGPIDGAGLGFLAAYDWPGNVRELRNVLERALVGSPGAARFRDIAFVPAATEPREQRPPATAHSFQEQRQQVIAGFERQFLSDLMAEHGGNILRASQASGIERTQLKRLLRRNRLL